MNVKPNRKAEQSQATRSALIATARALFAARGYAHVGTEEIVRAAGVTRGALYHQFADKADLFRAVYEDVERELVERVAGVAAGAPDPLAGLRVGAEAFLDACQDPAVSRIALIDAPSVLGWEEWREIGLRYGFGLIQGTLEAAMEAGQIERRPVRPLAHLLLGAIDEAALLVARDGSMRGEVGDAVARHIDAMR